MVYKALLNISLRDALALVAVGALAWAALAQHLSRRYDAGLGLPLSMGAIGAAAIIAIPMLTFSEPYNGTCSTWDEDWACDRITFAAMNGLFAFIIFWPLLVFWGVLYTLALPVCSLLQRLLVGKKSLP